MIHTRASRARTVSLATWGAMLLLVPLVNCSGDDAGVANDEGDTGTGDAATTDGTLPGDGAGPGDSSSADSSDASHAGDAPSDASDASDGAAGLVTLHGAVAKGPFINGSSVTIAPIDSAGNPTGTSYPTTTVDNIGTFSVDFTYQGPVQLTATGYYYNEIAGALSTSELTLNGYASITSAGSQDAYINLVTHLTHNRITTLLGGGTALASAVTEAEGELRTAFPVGGTSFNPGAEGTQLNLVGGDSLQSEYIFAVSSIVAEAAQLSTISGGTDAKLQSFVNTFSSDFGTSGTLPTATTTLLTTAQACVEPADVEAKLAARYASIGASTVVPDIDKAIDSDGDNVVNATDTCPLIANVTQTTVPNGICNYKAVATPSASIGSTSGAPASFAGDIDGVHGPDLFYLAGTNLYEWLNDGTATFATPVTIDLSTLFGASSGANLNPQGIQVLDMDHDGNADIFLQFAVQSSGPPATPQLAYLKGDGTGHFSSLVTIYKYAAPDGGPPMSFPGYTYLAVGDFNGDTIPDVAGANNGSHGIAMHLSQGTPTSPSWANPAYLAATASVAFQALAAVNIDGDAYTDLVATAVTAGSLTGGIAFIPGSASGLTLASWAPSSIAGTYVSTLATGDFDSDGKVDFAVSESTGSFQPSTLEVIWGDGTFNPATTPAVVSISATSGCPAGFSNGGSSISFSAADANGDGKTDIYLNGSNQIIIADAARSFLAPVTIDLTPGSTGTFAAGTNTPPPLVDFNGDGHADMFATGSGSGGGTGYNIGLINLAGNQSW